MRRAMVVYECLCGQRSELPAGTSLDLAGRIKQEFLEAVRLREKEGKVESPALTRPMTKKELGTAFGCHRNQVGEKVLANFYHEKLGARIRMRVDDMPAEWRAKNGLR